MVFFALALEELAKVALCLSLLQGQFDIIMGDKEWKLAAAHPLLGASQMDLVLAVKRGTSFDRFEGVFPGGLEGRLSRWSG